MRMWNTKKAATGTAAATLLMVAGAQIAQAVTEPSTPTYTGCLGTSGSGEGKLFAIAVGSSPRRGCTSVERLVRLSSGDITSVAGGQAVKVTSTELGTPDTNGSVSLDLAPQYKLPQGCSEGQVPKKAGGAWTCQSQLGKAFRGHTGHSLRPIGDDWSVLGDGLNLPAGSYAVAAKAIIWGAYEGSVLADCRLDATDTPAIDRAIMHVYDVNSTLTMSLNDVVSRSTPFRVSVVCRDNGVGTDWSQLRIVATPVNGFTDDYLGD